MHDVSDSWHWGFGFGHWTYGILIWGVVFALIFLLVKLLPGGKNKN